MITVHLHWWYFPAALALVGFCVLCSMPGATHVGDMSGLFHGLFFLGAIACALAMIVGHYL